MKKDYLELAISKIDTNITSLMPNQNPKTAKDYVYFIDIEHGEFKKQAAKLKKDKIQHPKRSWLSTADKLKTTLEEIKTLLPDYITIVDETYISMANKATFIDKEYGTYEARCKSVIRGHRCRKAGFIKAKQTNIEKYGCENVFQADKIKEKKKRDNDRKIWY